MKQIFAIFLSVILIVTFTGIGISETIVNPDTIVSESTGFLTTLDPDWAYDAGSDEVAMQLYDNLVQYDGTSTINLLPMLSTNVPSIADNTILDNGTTYIFHIRQGVYFHNGDILTPQDVIYSLERSVILDRAGGPSWMLAGPLLPMIDGQYVSTIVQVVANELGLSNPLNYTSLESLGIFATGTKNPLNDKDKQALINTFNLLARDFEVKGNDVIIHLPQPYAPFLYILASAANWTSILDQKWCVENKAWDGNADDWWYYHNPEQSNDSLNNIENGTGPYELAYAVPDREVVLKRFDKYWAGPAKTKNVVIKYVNSFTTSLLDLKSGQADIINVPAENLSEVEDMPGVRVMTGLPSLVVYAIAFQWNISSQGNPYIGSGKLDGNGILPDFFSNLDVRKAFEYLFPYKQFIDQALNGMSLQPNSAIVSGLLGYDPDLPTYEQNMAKAEEYFKKAYKGELWQKGFKFTAVYNDSLGQLAFDALSLNARKLNPKFQISVVGETTMFYPDVAAGKLPMFEAIWGADFPDPYDYAEAYYTSTGAYGYSLGNSFTDFAKKNLDQLVNSLVSNVVTKERINIAQNISKIDHEYALYIWLCQPDGYFVERTWIKGVIYNADYYPNVINFYTISK